MEKNKKKTKKKAKKIVWVSQELFDSVDLDVFLNKIVIPNKWARLLYAKNKKIMEILDSRKKKKKQI